MKKSVALVAIMLAAFALQAEVLKEISLEIENPYETNQFPAEANVLTPGVEAKITWRKELVGDYEHYLAIVKCTAKGGNFFIKDKYQLLIKLNSAHCGLINQLDRKDCTVWFDFYDWKSLGGAERRKSVPFASGDGTKENPYLIKTAAQLNSVRYGLDKHYRLAGDVDLSDWGNWLPIGATPTYILPTLQGNNAAMAERGEFLGTFDGAGHVVSGMKIVIHDRNIAMEKMHESRCYSLFAAVRGKGRDTVSIRNLGVVNCLIDLDFSDFNLSVPESVFFIPAAICADVQTAKIEGCYSSDGTLSVRTDGGSSVWNCGGLFGRTISTVIERCFNASEVCVRYSGSDLTTIFAGGIACEINGCDIDGLEEVNTIVRECYNSGSISVIFDQNENAADELMKMIQNGTDDSMALTRAIVAAVGNATGGQSTAGGIAGLGCYDFLARSCYNTGKISAVIASGIVGRQGNTGASLPIFGTVENCYNTGTLEATEYKNQLNPYASNGATACEIMNPTVGYGSGPVIRNNGVNTVSGPEWVQSARLGRKVLRAIPE